MKVEYAHYGIGNDFNMIITAKEFLKADTSVEEMEILNSIVNNYAGDEAIGDGLDEDEYHAVKNSLIAYKATKVIFSIHYYESEEYNDYIPCCNIWILVGKRAQPIRWYDLKKHVRMLQTYKYKKEPEANEIANK